MTPRGLSRKDAARYVGVSAGTFDSLVEKGTMPKPVALPIRKNVWDRTALDGAMDMLSCVNTAAAAAQGWGKI